MAGSVVEAAAELRQALAGVDVSLVSAADCARLADELAGTEKACASVRLLAAVRAVEAGAHRELGFKDGASWLARQSGTTGAQARQALQTAHRLEELPDTKRALLSGDISLAQAAEISQAAAVTSGAEAELLPVARSSDLSQLRDHAREHRQANTDPAEARRRMFATRELRTWQDRDGMTRIAAALPPEIGLPLVRRIEMAGAKARRAAGSRRERFEAHAADALAALVAGSCPDTNSRNTELVVVCDLFAWRRGHTHDGEVCHIIGGGPIPVDVAKELSATDAFVKAVLHDGTNVHTIKHFGRHIPATLRTALDLGPVPAFDGRACVDCGRRWGLEHDHIDPVANGGPTEYSNIQSRCWQDHQIKTERDRKAGLLRQKPSQDYVRVGGIDGSSRRPVPHAGFATASQTVRPPPDTS